MQNTPSSNSIEKTFIFEQQLTQVSTISKLLVSKKSYFDLREIFERVLTDSESRKYRIYNFQKNIYEELQNIRVQGTDYMIPWLYLSPQIILIKYTEETKSQNFQQLSFSDTELGKKQRSRQRTISQVLAIVKKWRQLHMNSNSNDLGKKLNLQQAAALIGISKKSLDDYFYQLRLGQKYGFNFKEHLNQKIGNLRTFIKGIKPKGRKKDKNQKHPKKLKILEQISPQYITLNSQKSQSSDLKKTGMDVQKKQLSLQQKFQQHAFQDQHDNFCYQQYYQQDRDPFNPFRTQSLKSIEDQFYNDFGLMINQQNDPFLTLGLSDRDRDIDEHQNVQMLNFTKKNKQIINLKKQCKMEQFQQINADVENDFLLN